MTYEIHKINTDLNRLPIRLLYFTHSSYDQGWHSIQHSHDFVELFYIVRGEGSFIVNNKETNVKKNQLIIINSNVNHTEKSSDKNSLEYITLGFDGISFSKKKKTSEDSIIIYEDSRIEVLTLIKYLVAEMRNNKDQAYLISQNILEIIILKLNQYEHIEIQESSNSKINSEIYELIKYIDSNYSESLTLDDLAELSHLNKYYMSHVFKNETWRI
ncbi:MAG: AraC family ligand binding domain-containing protein [Alkalibacterium sp.]